MIHVSSLSPRVLLKADLPIEQLSPSPLAVNGLRVLRYADQYNGIELTKPGYFKRKFVEWAAEEFQWPDYEPAELYSVNKVLNEPDFPPLCSLHDMLLRGRYIRHLKGKAILTKAGRQIMGAPGLLQAMFFDLVFLDDGPYGLSWVLSMRDIPTSEPYWTFLATSEAGRRLRILQRPAYR